MSMLGYALIHDEVPIEGRQDRLMKIIDRYPEGSYQRERWARHAMGLALETIAREMTFAVPRDLKFEATAKVGRSWKDSLDFDRL